VTQYSGGALTIQRDGSDGLTKIDAGTAGTSQPNVMSLVPEVYYLQLSNPGSQPTQVSWSLARNGLDSILNNSVGQGPALDLMLIGSPPTPTPTPTPTPSPSEGQVEAGPDDRVLAINEWIGQIGPAVLDVPPIVEAHTAERPGVRGEPGAQPERIVLVRDDTPAESSEAVDRADLATPLGFVAVTVGVMRFRRPLHRRFRRKGLSPTELSSILGTRPRGPHTRL
jgi:hypothetical protein